MDNSETPATFRLLSDRKYKFKRFTVVQIFDGETNRSDFLIFKRFTNLLNK